MPRKITVDINPGDHQRAEEITLTALIDPEVRLELLWIMHLLVAETGLAKDFRLHDEGDEILKSFPLDQHLWTLLVDSDIELLLGRGVERVGLF